MSFESELVKAGVKEEDVQKLLGELEAINWVQLIALLKQYGPIILQIIALFANQPKTKQDAINWQNLLAFIQAIIAMINQWIPTPIPVPVP